jgi:hypothetical protein
MTADHLFAMPKAEELAEAMRQGKKATARVYFKWGTITRRRWYKLADVPVDDMNDTRSVERYLRTAEAADYHHAVRYGRPVKKSELPQFCTGNRHRSKSASRAAPAVNPQAEATKTWTAS